MRTILRIVSVIRYLLLNGTKAAALQAQGSDIRIEVRELRERIKASAKNARDTETGLNRAIASLGKELGTVSFHRQQLEALDLSAE